MTEPSGIEKPAGARPQTAPVCQVCGEPLHARAVVQCRKCQTLHHLECWRFNKGCSLYGCGCRSSVKASNEAEVAGGKFEFETRTVDPRLLKVAGVLLACFMSALIASGIAEQPAVAAVSASLVPAMMYLGIRHGNSRDLLQLDPQRGTIRRVVKAFGRVVKTQEDWLAAVDIVEIHLHRIVVGGMLTWKIHALTTDGKRRLLYLETVNAALQKEEQVHAVAERIAVFADCTVREFEGEAGPSEAEAQEALAQRRHEVREALARNRGERTAAPATAEQAAPGLPAAHAPDPAPAEDEERGRSRVREG